MYLILFNENKQASCIVPTKNITKSDVYLFDKLPDFTPKEGYANSLHLVGDSLEWRFTKLPESTITEDDEIPDFEALNIIVGGDSE